MAKKITRKRKKEGWVYTKVYPHANHPAKYKRIDNDSIEYITFTHSPEVDHDGKLVQTVPLLDNISPAERAKNKREGKKFGENRTYAYPKVYRGKRSALGEETTEFKPVPFDKKRICKMFDVFPRENVPVTGGKSKNRHRQKKKPRKK